MNKSYISGSQSRYPFTPVLPRHVEAAIARGHWTKALSLECDRAIVQIETRFELQFKGVQS